MLEERSEHIEKLAGRSVAVARQFVAAAEECATQVGVDDPLLEDEHEPVWGLVHKYGNRVLCLLTAECAAYCRFCTRRRMVSDTARGAVGEDDIDRWAEYISAHPDVREVILSGGDPLVAPPEVLRYALQALGELPNVRVIRIGTRAPVAAPEMIDGTRLEALSSVRQPLYVGIHFEHPDELTAETCDAVQRLRRSGAILYSQTVFLAGVNDDCETLYRLFSSLVEIGVRPYYIYRCDPVKGAGHFRVSFEKERRIMTELRRSLSGLACPTYVIDTPGGSGKVPVPLEFWELDAASFTDFEGDEHRVV